MIYSQGCLGRDCYSNRAREASSHPWREFILAHPWQTACLQFGGFSSSGNKSRMVSVSNDSPTEAHDLRAVINMHGLHSPPLSSLQTSWLFTSSRLLCCTVGLLLDTTLCMVGGVSHRCGLISTSMCYLRKKIGEYKYVFVPMRINH